MIRCAEPKFKVDSLQDLINISKLGRTSEKKNRDINELFKVKNELMMLNDLVGLEELKKQIVYQIMFFIQRLNSDEMMHTALMGPPGVGKTTVAKILAKIYKKLGFLSEGKLIVVNREDLIGQYLGETAIKTRCVLEESLGNVLFIDEAYSLGSGTSHEDMYAKECTDTLTAFLSENTKNFICIIAGYENELQRCFFNSNPGLDRRFPYKYILQPYNSKELCEMFQNMLNTKHWKLRKSESERSINNLHKIIEENKKYFTNNGGDIQNFINTCMMAHSKRVFGNKRGFKKQLISIDVEEGFKIYKYNKKNVEEESFIKHLYT